jgi:acetyl-CoA hydrolase
VSSDDALSHLQSGMRVYIHPGCAEPEALVEAMMRRGPHVQDVEVMHLMTPGKAPYVEPIWDGHFQHRALFTGLNCREAVNTGRGDYVPVFLHEIPRLFRKDLFPIDIALIQVSPPDDHGFCSFGVGVECTLAAAQSARIVIAQVNEAMPRVHGDNFIHISDINFLVEDHRPLARLPHTEPSAMHDQIAAHIEPLIEDGSTLQLGIGGLPNAVLATLKDKKDLGIHTEMFSDGVVELVEMGIINGRKKNIHAGKVVASFVLGSPKLFDFVHDNPLIEFHPSDYVNDPFIISRHDNMVSINSAIQVDLSGQVCADSMGYRIYSGFGGQVDFIRGAARSKGGKPILALPSTAKGGTISRVVPSLDEGAGVVTSRADVDWIVTEYGAVNLFGLSLRERARALISIAHPDFQEELADFARKQYFL